MKKLIKITAAIAFCLFAGMSFAQNQFGSIKGNIILPDSTEAIGAYVWVMSNGSPIVTVTDYDGKFLLSAVPAGFYELTMTFAGDTLSQEIELKPDQTKMLNNFIFRTMIGEVVYEHVRGKEFIEPGEELKYTLSMDDLKQNANLRDLSALVGSMSSDIKVAPDGELYFRGARKGDMLYLIDGMKQTEFNSVPGVAIKSMTVYTGGLPAKYGDTCGGVVVMETKSYFDLYNAWEFQQKKAERLKKMAEKQKTSFIK